MRDIERIDKLLELLKKYWKQDENYADLRLGQILSNIAGNRDVFYLEDDEVIKWLEENINK